jgi:hypothetical protein
VVSHVLFTEDFAAEGALMRFLWEGPPKWSGDGHNRQISYFTARRLPSVWFEVEL